jgi:hypothetical protein
MMHEEYISNSIPLDLGQPRMLRHLMHLLLLINIHMFLSMGQIFCIIRLISIKQVDC